MSTKRNIKGRFFLKILCYFFSMSCFPKMYNLISYSLRICVISLVLLSSAQKKCHHNLPASSVDFVGAGAIALSLTVSSRGLPTMLSSLTSTYTLYFPQQIGV